MTRSLIGRCGVCVLGAILLATATADAQGAAAARIAARAALRASDTRVGRIVGNRFGTESLSTERIVDRWSMQRSLLDADTRGIGSQSMRRGLTAAGILGVNTRLWDGLDGLGARTGATSRTAVDIDWDDGSAVLRLQAQLKAAGLYRDRVDGVEGPNTRDAIDRFHRLPLDQRRTLFSRRDLQRALADQAFSLSDANTIFVYSYRSDAEVMVQIGRVRRTPFSEISREQARGLSTPRDSLAVVTQVVAAELRRQGITENSTKNVIILHDATLLHRLRIIAPGRYFFAHDPALAHARVTNLPRVQSGSDIAIYLGSGTELERRVLDPLLPALGAAGITVSRDMVPVEAANLVLVTFHRTAESHAWLRELGRRQALRGKAVAVLACGSASDMAMMTNLLAVHGAASIYFFTDPLNAQVVQNVVAEVPRVLQEIGEDAGGSRGVLVHELIQESAFRASSATESEQLLERLDELHLGIPAIAAESPRSAADTGAE